MRIATSPAAGFTLIELMIAVAVLAMIVAVGYPSYTSYVYDTRRTDGQVALMDAAQRLERCYSATMAYNEDDGGECDQVTDDLANSESPEGFYDIAIDSIGATTYALSARPKGPQADDKCGDLTLNQTGMRDIANADSGITEDDCW